MEYARSFPDMLFKYDVGVGETFTEYNVVKFMDSSQQRAEVFICIFLLFGSVSVCLVSYTPCFIPLVSLSLVYISVSDDF